MEVSLCDTSAAGVLEVGLENVSINTITLCAPNVGVKGRSSSNKQAFRTQGGRLPQASSLRRPPLVPNAHKRRRLRGANPLISLRNFLRISSL